MAYIDNEELNDIRSKANIVDIISSYGIEVIKKGKDYVCVCPFHNDHSPSMSISVSRQIYKCFACGEGGNVFTFVQNYEKVSFVEAVKIVAEKIDYHLKNDISVQRVDKHKKEHDILNLATMFFQNNLNTSSGIEAKKYLKDRKIDEKIINDFQIGLALDGKDDLFKLLHSKGYSADLLESLGLVTIVNDQVYDFFKGRVVFPILDIEGNVVGFSARIYRGEKDTSKYVNTKETLIFTKGNNLFNYYKARGPSKKEKQIIIVEGQMDAIRVYSSGIENVVALGGTALTQNQINLIKRLNVKVILCLDGDSAGEKATLVNGDLLTKNDINVQVVRLSDYKDPDEYIINKGIDAFKDNINNAIDYIDFKIKAQKKEININNTEELATYINKIIVDVSNIKDPILKEVTLNKISSEYNISLDILKNKLDSLNKEEKIAREIFVSDKKEVKKLNGIDIAIRKILFYMMNDIKYIKLYQNKIGFFEDKLYRDIANEIVYYSEKNQTINVADFISYIQTNEKLVKVIFEIIDANDCELNELEFINYIKVLNQKSSELRIKKIKEQIKLELDIDKKKKLLEEIAMIKQGSVKNEN
jgi:DNA primase